MLRLYTSSRVLTRKTRQLVIRQASGHAGGGGGGKVVKVVGGSFLITSLGVGGSVAYAGVDDQFRVMLEDSIPGADVLFEMVHGKITPAEPVKVVAKPKLRIGSSVVVSNPEEEKHKKGDLKLHAPPPPPQPVLDVPPPPPQPVLDVPPPPPQPVVDAPPPQTQPVIELPLSPLISVPDLPPPPPQSLPDVLDPVVEEPLQADVSGEEKHSEPENEMAPPLDVIEESKVENIIVQDIAAVENVVSDVPVDVVISITPDIENRSLESVLLELSKEMKNVVEDAVTGYQAATETVTNHMNIMKEVLETNLTSKDESAWNRMFEAAVAKSDATKLADLKEKEAIAAIENVIQMIAAGRKNKITANNIELMVAEESANSAIAMLEKAKAQGAAIKDELKVMEDYRDLVEAGREQFHKEMASIMPDVKLGEKNGKLSEEELNMFITHAYKKVLHLQQELARQQTVEQEKFKKALEKQKMDIHLGVSEKMESELSNQAKELALEQEKKINSMKEDLEKDIRAQLKRQAGAHSDHLQDMLSVQEAELSRNHEHILSEELHKIRTSHLEKMSALSGAVTGLSTSMQARHEQDKKAVKSQQLWIACSGLDAAMDTMKPLMGEVVMIKTAAMPDDGFVHGVLSSFSPVALDRGVYSMSNLKERFTKVEKVARRVAWVGEDGGSLLQFGLSYLQSLLMVDMSTRAPVEQEGETDLSILSQNDILTRAKHSLERNHLARAVQYATMLKGEPGMVVADWLSEARLTMETRQAVEALVVHSMGECVATMA